MSISMKRALLNPILIISGGLTLISGLFLFFHIKTFFIMILHEWVSIIFAAVCVIHLLLNWKLLLNSFKGRLPAWSLVLVLVVVTLAMGYSTTVQSQRPQRGKVYQQQMVR
ncbi:DUF4405 domain-containing protein [Desulfococcaceae bacterium OttesenSCG-928-F15]|nr:DUF4405 domain-containing protein [Desulfococcaceae bacterium OttesenSCG-928-F15]